MLEFLSLLDTSYRTIAADMERWFAPYPAGVAWNVFSDFCIGDAKKANDTFAFAIVLNHDTQANISEYIAAVAPSDIKASRATSAGLVSYLKSPVVFSVSYIVERQSRMLRDYITDENIKVALAELREILNLFERSSPPSASPYFRTVHKRISSFQQEVKKRNYNSGLARQIFLCAGFAAMVFKHLDAKKAPAYIRWISDRDAMFDKHDKVLFDLAFINFQILRSMSGSMSDRPEFQFGLPGWDGKNEFGEFIRIPDYLAGTLADMSLPAMEFTHKKFRPVFTEVFVNSPNCAVIEVLGNAKKITTRRIGFSAPIL